MKKRFAFSIVGEFNANSREDAQKFLKSFSNELEDKLSKSVLEIEQCWITRETDSPKKPESPKPVVDKKPKRTYTKRKRT